MIDFIAGKIITIIDESPRVKRFFWQASTDYNFSFNPGQFAIINFIELAAESAQRSYSIADKKDSVLEFCISYKENGTATALIWQKKIGDILHISPPKGSFILQYPLPKCVFFIATGTGIAPFKPMIAHLIKNHSDIEISLIYGNRNEEDILYASTWNDLAKKNSNFKFYPVLSKETKSFAHGYVHQIYPRLILPNMLTHFYICGWNAMIKETRQNLKTMGYSRQHYFIESYD